MKFIIIKAIDANLGSETLNSVKASGTLQNRLN